MQCRPNKRDNIIGKSFRCFIHPTVKIAGLTNEWALYIARWLHHIEQFINGKLERREKERKGSGARSIVDTAVQCLEVRNALGIKPNHLCIEYRGTFESRPRFDDQRIAL